MEITVNGKKSTSSTGATVADVVRECGIAEDATGVAVAVNDTVVPRGQWRARRLAAGDVVEIIRAVQGG
jgi:sulfur carrier protein